MKEFVNKHYESKKHNLSVEFKIIIIKLIIKKKSLKGLL